MTAEKIRLEVRVDAETGAPYVCDQDGRTFAGGKSSSFNFEHDDYARATITARLHANGKPMLNAGGGLRKESAAQSGHPSAEQVDRELGKAIHAALNTQKQNPGNWEVGDVVCLSGADGGDSKYWSAGKDYEVTEKSAHGTIFLSCDGVRPIEISMGIARRWFRLASNGDKLAEHGKSDERKQHKSFMGALSRYFYKGRDISLRNASCGAYDVSDDVVTRSYTRSDGTKVTEKTYDLPSSVIAEERYQVQIDILEETVANLRAELKERKEESGYPCERIVKLNAAAFEILAKADIGSALIYQHPDDSTTLIWRIQ